MDASEPLATQLARVERFLSHAAVAPAANNVRALRHVAEAIAVLRQLEREPPERQHEKDVSLGLRFLSASLEAWVREVCAQAQIQGGRPAFPSPPIRSNPDSGS